MKCINVRDTGAHYGRLILEGKKTIETRTPEAWKRIQKALHLEPGETIGICCAGVVVCTVAYRGTVNYSSRGEFLQDLDRHHVAPGSMFDYVDGIGKMGILLDSPAACHIQAEKLDRPQGWRIV